MEHTPPVAESLPTDKNALRRAQVCAHALLGLSLCRAVERESRSAFLSL